MKDKQRKAMFANKFRVYAKNRKQETGLDVNSPPPESYNSFKNRSQALKWEKDMKEKYHDVKLIKVESEWMKLRKNYPMIKTPDSLAINVKDKKPGEKGFYFKYGFSMPYTVSRIDDDIIVVSTDKVNSGGGTAGGHYYINKNNTKQSVWD